MPCPKDWVVLDALNYIKDQIDGTLSYRWSCRMGVCGSCGMTVNGEPKLTCATFLTDYAPGPMRVEPLENFPVIRDLVVEIGDFMRKLTTVKPWIIREEEKPTVRGRVPRRRRRSWTHYKPVQHVHQLHAVLCGLPDLQPRPEVHRAGGDRAGAALQPRLARRGREERLEVLSQHDGIWGCTFVGECTKVCPKNVDPAGAIQRYKLEAALDWVKGFVMPWGAR